MKNILVLGAGQSSPYLIKYLLDSASENSWFVTVADMNCELASSRINGNPNGNAVEFDVNDEKLRNTLIKISDIVINFLAPPFQYLIALDCLQHSKHMISASYENPRVAELHRDAMRKGILILNEMGLDPGIDHMSAIRIINKIRERNGEIHSFISYGSGIPAPEVNANPLNYCLTWNPRNVVMAGEAGAQYMELGKIKLLPHYEVFQRTWSVDVDGVGTLEAYPNRDSLIYLDVFKLQKLHTMIRGTLRYPGWSETWNQIVRLGIPNETLKIPELCKRTYAEFTEMFLPLNASGTKFSARLANFLGINPTGKIMQNIKWLGLLDDKLIGGNPKTPAEVMVRLMSEKMMLPKGARDMVVLIHEIEAKFPNEKKREKIVSTLVEYGEPDGLTAISKTVGLPAAIAAKLILHGEIPLTGCHIPTHPMIYTKVLNELETFGIKFSERVEKI